MAEAAALGFLGGDVDGAIEHALGFARVLRPCQRLLDLGSGGGLPGLVLAEALPDVAIVLLDASERRADWLHRAVGRLALGDRVTAVCQRAEAFGRVPGARGGFGAVVARGFGRPGLTAECAAPLLAVGGQLVVSEPPEPDDRRWPSAPLTDLGLERDVSVTERYASFTQVALCPGRFPRRRLDPPLF